MAVIPARSPASPATSTARSSVWSCGWPRPARVLKAVGSIPIRVTTSLCWSTPRIPWLWTPMSPCGRMRRPMAGLCSPCAEGRYGALRNGTGQDGCGISRLQSWNVVSPRDKESLMMRYVCLLPLLLLAAPVHADFILGAQVSKQYLDLRYSDMFGSSEDSADTKAGLGLIIGFGQPGG